MDDMQKQYEKIKYECYLFTQMFKHDKIRIEYNRNKKINDRGKLEVLPVLNEFSEYR